MKLPRDPPRCRRTPSRAPLSREPELVRGHELVRGRRTRVARISATESGPILQDEICGEESAPSSQVRPVTLTLERAIAEASTMEAANGLLLWSLLDVTRQQQRVLQTTARGDGDLRGERSADGSEGFGRTHLGRTLQRLLRFAAFQTIPDLRHERVLDPDWRVRVFQRCRSNVVVVEDADDTRVAPWLSCFQADESLRSSMSRFERSWDGGASTEILVV